MNKCFAIALLAVFFSTALNALIPNEGIYQLTYTVESTSPTPIYQAELAPITTSGYYALSENISGEIQISVNDVMLDLNGYTVTNAGGDGIVIDPGVSNIVIMNGAVGPVSSSCLIGGTGSKNIVVRDCLFTGSEFAANMGNISSFLFENCIAEGCEEGFSVAGGVDGIFKNCTVNNLEAIGNRNCIAFAAFLGAYNIVFDNCHANGVVCNSTDTSNYAAGFELAISSDCIFRNCSANAISSTADATAYGFKFSGSPRTIFENCNASNIVSACTSAGQRASGFDFNLSPNCSLINCTAQRVQATDNASAIGMALIQSENAVLESVEVRDIATVSANIFAAGIFADRSESSRFSDCSVLAVEAAGQSAAGFYILNSDQSLVTGCIANNIVTATTDLTEYATGFWVRSSVDCILKDCLTSLLDASAGTSDANGFYCHVSPRNVVENCQVSDVVGTRSAYGFKINGASCLVKNCTARHLLSQDSSSYGYGAMTNDASFENCVASDIRTVGEGISFAYGYSLLRDRNILQNCLAYDIEATAMDAIAAGVNTPDTFQSAGLSHGTPGVIETIDWNRSGDYVAIGYDDTVEVLYYDGSTLASVTTANLGVKVYSVKWSPNGQYLAAAGGDSGAPSASRLRIYQFNGSSLSVVDSYNPASQYFTGVDWHPAGQYVGVSLVHDTSTNGGYYIFGFDGSALTSSTVNGNQCTAAQSFAWHPSGKFVAVGGDPSLLAPPFVGNTVFIYPFNPATTTPGVTAYIGLSTGDVTSVDWSADGKHLAAGTNSGPYSLLAFVFDGLTIEYLDVSSAYGNDITEVRWHPSSSYIAVSGLNDSGDRGAIFVLQDGGLRRLPYSVTRGSNLSSVAWQLRSPHLLTFAGLADGGNNISAYTSIVSNCVINNNLVTNVQTPWGKGYGYNVVPMWHMFDKNEGYLNDFNYSDEITDVYSGGMAGMPGIIQNISL